MAELYKCLHCQFTTVDGVPVRDSAGKVLKKFTDELGVVHEPEKEQVPDP